MASMVIYSKVKILVVKSSIALARISRGRTTCISTHLVYCVDTDSDKVSCDHKH